MNILLGMKILWIIFWGHHKIGLYLEVISIYFKVFSYGQGTELGIFFWVAKFSNIFWGCLKFLIFFLGEGQMLGPSLRMQKKK